MGAQSSSLNQVEYVPCFCQMKVDNEPTLIMKLTKQCVPILFILEQAAATATKTAAKNK